MASESRKHRRSIRLPAYDYAQAGAYYVTVCVKGRACVLGDVVDGESRPSDIGEIVQRAWTWLGERFPFAKVDDVVVMPNHIHGIIWILPDERRGGSRAAPTTAPDSPKPLGQLVGAFKTRSTKEINLCRQTPGALFWQRNYYEHVIRDDDDLFAIRQYIADNPAQWALDEENPNQVRPGSAGPP